MDKFLGKRLDGRYEIQDIIGIGGMAVVYKAYDNIENKVVAVKILKEEYGTNNEFLRRFKNESKAVSVLNHPNIVKIYDVSFGDNFQYIVMEYIDGITLKEYIARQGVLTWKEAVFFTVQILHALQHAHDKGIVHRDVKPQNILMLRDGTIKVTDFGIAHFARSDEHTITDKAIGSVHYISPEQARGDTIDEKADLYSVGVLLYEMLTGSLPFQADSAVSVAIMQMQIDAKPPREVNPDIPVGLEQITMRAMRKNPNKRYLSDSEMLRDLEEFKRNPSVVFNYDTFDFASIDDSPTRYVDTRAVAAATAASKIDQLYGTATNNTVDEFDSLSGSNVSDDEDDDEEKKRSSLIPALAAVAVALFVILAGFGTFVLIKAFGGKTGDITCPSVIGQDYLEATEKYSDSVELVVKEWRFNDEYKYGQIIEQQYDPGKSLKKGSQVNIIVSKGVQTFNIPDVYGMTSAKAKQTLEEYGLNTAFNIIHETSETIEKDIVIKTDPQHGALVTADTVISIYVSAGKPTVYTTVPSVTNIKLDLAKEMLERSRLKVGSIVREDSDMPEGFVLTQSIKAGSSVGEYSSVDLVVSTGVEPTEYKIDITVVKPSNYPDKAYAVVAELNTSSGSKSKQTQTNKTGVTSFKFSFKTTSEKCTIYVTLDGHSYQEYSVNRGIATLTDEKTLVFDESSSDD